MPPAVQAPQRLGVSHARRLCQSGYRKSWGELAKAGNIRLDTYKPSPPHHTGGEGVYLSPRGAVEQRCNAVLKVV
jgi:hypothetical protein